MSELLSFIIKWPFTGCVPNHTSRWKDVKLSAYVVGNRVLNSDISKMVGEKKCVSGTLITQLQ